MQNATTADLIEAIRASMRVTPDGDDEDALTIRELSEQTGLGIDRVRKLLRPLVLNGTVEITKVYRQNVLDERVQPITAYRLVDKDNDFTLR